MSVENTALLAKGWELENEDFEENPLMNPMVEEKLFNEGYLHNVDAYYDSHPLFLGAGIRVVHEGSMVALNFSDAEVDSASMKEVQEIARKYFNITEPPKFYLIAQVY